TRWETIQKAVLPYARGGIAGAAILGLARALGETMAVTMVIGNSSTQIRPSLFTPGYTLASAIANQFTEADKAIYFSAIVERPLPPGEVGGGVAPAIVGTLLMLVTAGLIGVPIGIGTAIYLAEYGRGGFARTVSFIVNLIAGLPSIVVGVFVWAWLVRSVIG